MADLTKTEVLTVQLLSDGMNAPEIAEMRHRHRETVRTQIKNAREKLGAKTVAQLVKICVQRGLIHSFLAVCVLCNSGQALRLRPVRQVVSPIRIVRAAG